VIDVGGYQNSIEMLAREDWELYLHLVLRHGDFDTLLRLGKDTASRRRRRCGKRSMS
jgi:hypothetical protein